VSRAIRRLFQDESGVVVLSDSNPRGERGYTSLRISVRGGGAGVAGAGDQMSEPMSLPVSMDAERFLLL
jgi:hypothetical protein